MMPEPRAPAALFSLALRRLLGDARGSAGLQLAFALPVLLTVIFGIIEVSGVLFVTGLMEGGLREAARFGVTGFTPDGQTRQDRILAVLTQHGQGLIDPQQAEIAFLVYPSFDSIGQPEPFVDENGNGQRDASPPEPYTDTNGNGQWDSDMGAAGLGGPADIVLYTVRYDWPLFNGYLAHLIGENGVVPLEASLVVRNEPFNATGG